MSRNTKENVDELGKGEDEGRGKKIIFYFFIEILPVELYNIFMC